MFFKNQTYYVLFSILSLNIVFNVEKVYSFVPQVYEPKIQDLKKTGLRIGDLASKFIRYGPPREGKNLAKLAVALHPKKVELWVILAEGQIRNNELKDALLSIKTAKEIDPSLASLWFAEASIALQRNEPKTAVELLEEGLKLDSKNANAHFQLGNAKLLLGRLKSALKSFKQSTKLQPQFWQAANNQGLVYFELGNIKKAISIWRDVLKMTNDAEPKLALAAALNQEEKNNKEAITLAEEALNTNANYVSEKHQKEQLWGRKLQKATKELFQNENLEETINKAFANSYFPNN